MLEDDKAMYDEGDYDDDDDMLEANVIAWVNRCVVNTLRLHRKRTPAEAWVQSLSRPQTWSLAGWR